MRKLLQQLRQALVVAGAAVLFAACGGTPTSLLAPEMAPTTHPTTTPSVTIRGTVVDAANRPVAGAHIECLGDGACRGPFASVVAEGHGHRATVTSADGSFEIVAASRSGGDVGEFAMNANRRGYHVEWRQVAWPDPECTSDQCSLTVDFALTSLAD